MAWDYRQSSKMVAGCDRGQTEETESDGDRVGRQKKRKRAKEVGWRERVIEIGRQKSSPMKPEFKRSPFLASSLFVVFHTVYGQK